MIYKDKHFIFVSFQVIMPYLEDFDNSQKLTIINFISYF